jgi:hypothetical protein
MAKHDATLIDELRQERIAKIKAHCNRLQADLDPKSLADEQELKSWLKILDLYIGRGRDGLAWQDIAPTPVVRQ